MKILDWKEILNRDGSERILPAAATIGVFDGLHLGHKELLRRVIGHGPGLLSLVVTFRDNPKKSTRAHKPSGNLVSLEQKLELLADEGIQVCVLIDFSTDFSKMGGEEFISILVRSCGVHTFVVGSDFKCGHRLSTDALGVARIARSLGSETDIVDPVNLDGMAVSSSRIRATIQEGRMDQALAMLGRPYTLDLRSVHFDHDKDMMSTSISRMGSVVPHQGKYAVQLEAESGTHPTIAFVGADGTLSWVQGEGDKPRFIRILDHIA